MKFRLLSLLLLRLALGSLFLYAGLVKVFDQSWTAKGYLMSAGQMQSLYSWLADSANIFWVNGLNEWALTLLGLSLLLGIAVRVSAPLGVVLMLLYYLALPFPYPNSHSFIVDEHIVYSAALLVLTGFNAGRHFGLDGLIARMTRTR